MINMTAERARDLSEFLKLHENPTHDDYEDASAGLGMLADILGADISEVLAKMQRDGRITEESFESVLADKETLLDVVRVLTAERDDLRAKLERITNPPVKSIGIDKEGALNVSLDGPEMARIIAGSFWDMLTEQEADNYVEMTFSKPETPLKKVIVTVRKVYGRTPDEMRRVAEQERDELRAEVARLTALLGKPTP